MTTSVDTDFPITLQALQRLETESLALHNHQEVIRYFCLQVIPFLSKSSELFPLWEDLRFKYEELSAETERHEKNAISEIKRAFRKIEAELKRRHSIPNALQDCLEKARATILKNRLQYITHPIFRVYDEEFRNLLQELLKTGYRDICEKYAELIDLDEYTQKDPSEKEQWCLLNDDWKIEKFIPADEIKESDKTNNSRLYCIHPEKILIKAPYIRSYIFAPSTLKAWVTLKQIHWNQHDNPAVVWQYFKAALWCWNTPRSHFAKKIQPPKTAKEMLKFWKQSAEYSTWREISRAKEKEPINNRIVIFTEGLFKKGFSTLINSIAGFLTQKEQTLLTTIDLRQNVLFELFMYKRQLWISMDSLICKEKFCIQRFKDSGYQGGSEQEKFCKQLVPASINTNDQPHQIEFDNVAHVLDRLKLPKIIKKFYFGSTYGNTVHYMGPRLTLLHEMANIKLMSKALEDVHRSNGSPPFISDEK